MTLSHFAAVFLDGGEGPRAAALALADGPPDKLQLFIYPSAHDTENSFSIR
jgi:hypothetical protein